MPPIPGIHQVLLSSPQSLRLTLATLRDLLFRKVGTRSTQDIRTVHHLANDILLSNRDTLPDPLFATTDTISNLGIQNIEGSRFTHHGHWPSPSKSAGRLGIKLKTYPLQTIEEPINHGLTLPNKLRGKSAVMTVISNSNQYAEKTCILVRAIG